MTANEKLAYPFYPKQLVALTALSVRNNITDILYGGSKGPGKTALGCRWQIEKRLLYKGSKGIIGRSELKELRKSTLVTLFEWLGRYGLVIGRDYTFNGQELFIKFYNGSEIHFFDLFDYPSDPDFQRFGGIEIMDFFVDEASEISEKCFITLKTLCRKGTKDYCNHCDHHDPKVTDIDTWICTNCGQETSGLPIKGLMTCNPSKNWLYHKFYSPWKKDELKPKQAFIPALPKDNPSLPKSYLDALDDLPEPDRSRLKDGNWDFDESKDRLFEFSDLERMFSLPETTGQMYTTADIAAMGDDETIIGVWCGLSLIQVYIERHKLPHEVAAKIREINTRHAVPMNNTIVDSDGLGIGVYGILKCKQFLNGGRSTDPQLYENMRAECYFKLAELVRLNRVSIHIRSEQERITRELDAIRRKNMNSERKLSIIPREQIMKALGNSPDRASMIMMRMYFELKPNSGVYRFGGG